MKMKLIYVCIALAIVTASCNNSNEVDETTQNGDTAILVEDPANELQASPINDTTIVVDTTAY